jgi:hypothetical protein
MLLPINNTGQYGVVTDIPGTELPENAWTDCRNIEFLATYARSREGWEEVLAGCPQPPRHAFHVAFAAGLRSDFWIVLSATRAYLVENRVYSEITPRPGGVVTPFSGTSRWSTDLLSGIPVMTNNREVPHMWFPSTVGTFLTPLSAWPAGVKCKSIKSFKQFLIALNITKGTSPFPSLVKWSHPADSGALPNSWNEADPTKLAGESARLAETQDEIVDGLTLRDTFIIYKENSVWGMQVVGNLDVFRIFKIFDTGGMLDTNCATEYINGMHAVFGAEDIYKHDGQSMVSIVTDKVRESIYESLDETYFRNAFVVHNPLEKAVIFAYPTQGNEYCNKALVWNYQRDTLSFIDLPGLSHIAIGPVSAGASVRTWENFGGTWANATSPWRGGTLNVSQDKMLYVSVVNTKLYFGKFSQTADTEVLPVHLERVALPLPAVSGKPPDATYKKRVRTIWPRIRGTDGTIVKISYGYHEEAYSPIKWVETVDFIIGTSRKIDCHGIGRLFAIRFWSDTVAEWALDSYEVEYTVAGRF